MVYVTSVPKVYITRGWFGHHYVYVRDAKNTRWVATCKTIEVAQAIKAYMDREINRAIAGPAKA